MNSATRDSRSLIMLSLLLMLSIFVSAQQSDEQEKIDKKASDFSQ
jgi:thioredoxin-related protein